MGTGSHRWKARIFANPTRESVAHRVFAHFEPRIAAQLLHICAGFDVGFGEDHTSHHGRWFLGDGAERIQLRCESFAIDFDFHRFQSL